MVGVAARVAAVVEAVALAEAAAVAEAAGVESVAGAAGAEAHRHQEWYGASYRSR